MPWLSFLWPNWFIKLCFLLSFSVVNTSTKHCCWIKRIHNRPTNYISLVVIDPLSDRFWKTVINKLLLTGLPPILFQTFVFMNLKTNTEIRNSFLREDVSLFIPNKSVSTLPEPSSLSGFTFIVIVRDYLHSVCSWFKISEVSLGNLQDGHTDCFSKSQLGPCHQSEEFWMSIADKPLSDGFWSDALSLCDGISQTLFSTKTGKGFLVFSQYRTHWESVHRICSEIIIFNSAATKFVAQTSINTPISSNLGTVNFLFFFLLLTGIIVF